MNYINPHFIVISWLENNKPTIENIKEQELLFYTDLINKEPVEFHDDIKKEYNSIVKKQIHKEIASDTGIGSDIIYEVLEEMENTWD